MSLRTSTNRITTARSSNLRVRGAATKTLAVLYENHEWMAGLFDQLDQRGLDYDAIDLTDGAFLLDAPGDYSLVINRVSPSAYLRGHGSAIRLASSWLETLERSGRRVINGARSFQLETSKVAQHLLIRDLGLRVPATAVFNDRHAIRSLARDFPFPAILKPDMGGSGAYVRFVANREHLETLLRDEPDLFGPDHMLLLQEFITAADGTIMRIELVDGEFLFAMRVRPTNTFNLCPAEGCERPSAQGADADDDPDVEFDYEPDVAIEAVAQAREIVRAAGLDVGGVEYIETADGRRYFYDINATSVYRPDIVQASGVDAQGMFGAFVERELAKELRKRSDRVQASMTGAPWSSFN
jgi:glutathione synthase/RimK-type ligase-like ATP-grasp enzyme